MTGKRFEIFPQNICKDGTLIIIQKGLMLYNISDVVELLNTLHDENGQLQQQLTSIDRLIDKKIDEFKNGDYGDLPCNTIHMFLDLKQEIEEFK